MTDTSAFQRAATSIDAAGDPSGARNGQHPEMVVAECYSSDLLPFGLGEPMALLGGGRIEGVASARLGFEWNQIFLRNVDAACRRQLASGRQWFRMDPVMLTGPFGAGRTHLARRLAWEMGVPHLPVYVGEQRGGWSLGSTACGPTSARPSMLGIGIATGRCANPIIDVTGIETAAPETVAKLVSAMDPLLGRFDDEGLGVTFDLSEATWIVQLPPDAEIPSGFAEIARVVPLTLPSGDQWSELAWIEALVEVAADRGLAGGCERLSAWDPAHGDAWRDPNMSAFDRYRLAEAAFDQAYGPA